MASIKLTSKRQATLPSELCDELHVGPGDKLDVERRILDGEVVWVLRPRTVDWSWIGSSRVPADASHDMEAIRASIAARRPESK